MKKKVPMCPICGERPATENFVEIDENDNDVIVWGRCHFCESKAEKTQKNHPKLKNKLEPYEMETRDMGIGKRFIKANIEDFKIVEDSWFTESVYFHGPAGSGKTHLAVALLKEDLKNERQVLFIPVVELITEIKKTYSSKSEVTEFNVVEKYQKIPHLYIDDLGVERGTAFVGEVLYAILDYRYRHLRRTVITSNLDVDELAVSLGDRGERIASRIAGSFELVEMKGKGRRTKGGK